MIFEWIVIDNIEYYLCCNRISKRMIILTVATRKGHAAIERQ